MQLSFGDLVLAVFKIVAYDVERPFFNPANAVCYLYQQNVLHCDLQEKDGSLGGEKEELLPKHSFVDLRIIDKVLFLEPSGSS